MDLLQNPFHILAATTRDNRQKIMALADERALLLDSNECTQARSDLTHPRKRLSAEIAWMPGTGLRRASEVLRYLESVSGMLFGMAELTQFKNILGADRMIPIAQANLLAAGLSRFLDYPSDFVATWVVSEWIVEIANVFESIDPETVHVIINEERTVSGFPAITDLSAIETEIQERRYHYRQVITSALDKLHIKECAGAVTRVVLAETNNKEKSRLTLIEDIVNWYELAVQESLEKEERKIRVLDEKVRTAVDAKSSDTALVPMISQLIQAVKNWGSFAQPIQIIKRSQGLSHKASYRVAGPVRKLVVDLFNQYGKLEFARQLIDTLQEVFAEVDELAERIAEDARALNKIAEKRAQRARIKIETLVEKIRAAADEQVSDSILEPMVNQLIQAIKNLDTIAQSTEGPPIAISVRKLALDLFNKHDKLDFSQRLTDALQRVFAEVGELAERLAEDASTLNKIVERRVQRVKIKIETLVEKIRAAADEQVSDSILEPMVNQLIQIIKNLDIVAQPRKSYRVVVYARALAVDLFNKYDKLDFSRQLTYTLQEVCAEIDEIAGDLVGFDLVGLEDFMRGVDELAEHLAEDARTLAKFAEQRKQRVKIEALIEKLRAAADGQSPDSILAPMVNQLIQAIKNSDIVAQPMKSHLIAISVRDLAVDLFNDHDKLDFARQLIHMLQGVFAEVSEVAEQIAEDARALNEIADRRTQATIEHLHMRQETEQREGNGCLVAFLIGIGLIVFIGLINSC